MSDKKPIAFCTNISDPYYHSMGADKLIKSAAYFHPEIPFIVYGSEDVKKIDLPHTILMAPVMLKLIDEYEWVVRFDADSIITGRLDELLHAIEENDCTIIGVRNNNDYNMAGADHALGQHGAGTEHYLNAGLIATKSRVFLEEWVQHNIMYGDMLPFQEQTTLNGLQQKYDTLMIDSKEDDVFYGVSGLYGNGEEGQTHWDSWKDIVVVQGELYLQGKKVKVVHHAGGFNANKLGYYMFSDQARKRLIEITG